MAHNIEPMDLDSIDSDFDNKENSLHHNNVLQCTEKGYEELDVSELNMKLRYSITPAASPMSKSYTHCIDNKKLDTDDSLNCVGNEGNLTRSYNSTLSKNDNVNKIKSLPLQSLPKDQFFDGNKNALIVRQLDTTGSADNTEIKMTGIDAERLSLPSSSSSTVQTPEATTPIKDVVKDGGSPIMRGLKSVFNMFRTSTSPIPPGEDESKTLQTPEVNPGNVTTAPLKNLDNNKVAMSTPISAHRKKEGGSKRSSPLKDSIVFNDEIEKELQWKDETTIFLNHEKIPIHKLFLHQSKPALEKPKTDIDKNLNSTVEYMDISYNDSHLYKTMTEGLEIKNDQGESDGEFVDCETTFTKSLSLAKEMSEDQYNSINKETGVSNYNVTMEHLVKEASKVMLNITVPVNNENLSVHSVLEESKKHHLNEGMITEINNVPLDVTMSVESKLGPSINITPGNIDILGGSHLSNLDNVMHAQNEGIAPTEVSLDSIEVNSTETPEVIDNVVAIEPLDFAKLTIVKDSKEIIDSCMKIEDIESQTVPDSDPDSLVATYELDSLELNVKSDNMNMDKVPVLGSVTFPPKSAADNILHPITYNEVVVNPVIEVPADIPLPDDEEFDKSLSSILNNTKIQNKYFTSDVEDYAKIFSVCPEGVNAVTSNKSIMNEDVIPNTDNFKVDTSLDIGNQSNLSQILNDVDYLLKSDCDGSELDTKELESESIIKINVQSITENQNVTMNICESVMRPETLPDILNHSTTLNLENADIVINDEILDQTQVISSPITKIQADTKHEDKPVILVDQLSIDEDVNIFNNSVGAKAYLTESNEHNNLTINESAIIKNKVIEMNSKASHCIEGGIRASDKCNHLSVVRDEQQAEVFSNNSQENPNEIFNNMYLIHDRNSENEIESCDTTLTHSITKDEQVNLKQEIETQGNVSLNKSSKHICTEIVKKRDTLENVITENIHNIQSTQLDLENQNETFGNGQIDVSLVNVLTEKQMNVEDLHQVNNNYSAEPVKNDSNMDMKQDIIREEKIEKTNSLTTETETISRLELSELKIDDTEKDIGKYIPFKVQDNENNIVTTNTNPVTNNNVLDIDKHSNSIDEEIIVSGNNSPYVSVVANVDIVSEKMPKETLEHLTSKSYTDVSSLNSPPIASKGYNFNFDDISDPFSTKAKIRQSPTLELSNKDPELPDKLLEENIIPKNEVIKNRRLSEPERKRPVNKRKLNTSLNNTKSVTEPLQNISDVTITTDIKFEKSVYSMATKKPEIDTFGSSDKKCLAKETSGAKVFDTAKNLEAVNMETNLDEQGDVVEKSTESFTDNKTSSSEHSTYYSAGTSSNDSIKSKNVFNLPEIDDINFNPFATKTKLRESTPPLTDINNFFENKIKPPSSPNKGTVGTDTNYTINLAEPKTPTDKMDTEPMEKESLANSSTATCSSKETDDKDVTVCEIHTEDEDTEEGPFLEADDNDVKILNFDEGNVNMMQIPDLEPQGQEDAETRELFIDAETFEFLINQKSTNVVADSGKESLFLKFDPLFAKRISSDGVFAALSKIQKRQSTPSNLTKTTMNNTPIQPSSLTAQVANTTNDLQIKTLPEMGNDDQNMSISKPMMVVTPAVNPVPLPRKSITPTRSNRRSLTFTSPAMAVIDRLLSMSANNSLCEESVTMVSQEQHEAESALTQLRELLAEKEIHVYNLRHESEELRDRLSAMDMQMKSLESEGQGRLRKINELNEKLAEKSKINRSMATVVEEYERTIASLISETEQDRKRHAEERMKLTNERDEQTAHLASMEVSFSDLHTKYEKSKQVILTYKANEDAYKKSLAEFEENLTKMQNNYELLKQHATSKLNHANQEFEKMNRAHEAEVLKLNAMIKRKDLHITSLEETLAQKTKANEELTAICDELINKVG
ncbi:hypothetical protein K1T71_010624 [Dendrolimus kikuchii]|uniref:Uncharacterized protein n=1 Tax=Dendrolimus kikuchii TaxID=765133 RepID=A0ACC1CPE2_9NEOP|nr:hypothetical protein K1T71_010624 [Dendrolimus kikuchii]